MPIESFSYISSLNSSNPGGSDGILQGDDHIRGIKATLLASFPAISGATTVTHTRLNELQAGALTGAISISGALAVTGAITGPGACPTGMIADFLAVPVSWLELDGSAISRTTYATLFAQTTVGGGTIPGFGVGNGTTTFTLPNLTDKYRRSRGTNAVTATLANQNKTHTHTASTSITVAAGGSHNHGGVTGGQSVSHTHSGSTSADGTHNHGGASGGQSVDHTHATYGNGAITGWTGAGTFSGSNVLISAGANTGGSSNDHTHVIASDGNHGHTFTTGAASVDHNHAIAAQADHTHTASGTVTVTADGGSEARPDSYVVITCIKT